jgi:glycosyltransferase involved in cell wall biosynthesis
LLAVIETHPIQYHAPVYRALQTQFGIPVTAIYGSDFSVAGYEDREFGTTFAWDTDLLRGYTCVVLSRVSDGGARTFDEVSASGLREALRKVTPSAVLISGYSPHFNQVAFYEAWRGRYPILFRGETTDHTRHRSLMKASLRDGALRWGYRHCARLLYIGERSYHHYKRLGSPKEKLIFSPYCVDTDPFRCDDSGRTALRSAVRKRMGIEEAKIVLLFSGKLSARKGPDLLLQAVKALPLSIRDKIVVLFLGSGELEERLKSRAQAEPGTETRFVGFQNQTELSGYYHAADLLVLPSREGETWGLVVNEGLHHGLPCVISEAVGCAPDLMDPGITGEICQSNSAESLTAAIVRALPLIGRSDIREKCRQRVAQYTVAKAAGGIATAYQEVTGCRQSTASFA